MEYTEEMGMKEAMSSHNLSGLSLIASLYTIVGIILVGASVLLLILGFLNAIIMSAGGILMIAIGYYLDDLREVAWWVVVITNFLSLIGIFIGIIFTSIVAQVPLGLLEYVTSIGGLLFFSSITYYLLQREVRNLFFD